MTKPPEDKLFENIIDNLGKPKVKPKRSETFNERFERLHHLYDDGPKPKHFDDKSIVDMEKWNSMKGLEKKTPVIKQPNPLDNNGPFSMEVKRQIKDGTYGPGNKKDIVRPKPFKNEDPSTYPMNQKREMNMFEQMLSTVKNPKTKEIAPAFIESSPRSGPTVLSSTIFKGAGRAPDLRSKAKSVAD